MKRLFSLAVALAITMLLMLTAAGSSSRRTVTVVLNGETISFDTPAYIENNRTMVPIRAIAEALGLEVTWDQASATAWLSDESWTPSLKGRTIVVDPGHGGSADGASYGGVKESDLNLSIAQHLAEELRRYGANVVMTRTGDQDVSLSGRAAIANRVKADLFQETVSPGDAILLCSDGLVNQVTDQEICQEIQAGGTAQEICQRLVTRTLDSGAPDNVTVVLFQL